MRALSAPDATISPSVETSLARSDCGCPATWDRAHEGCVRSSRRAPVVLCGSWSKRDLRQAVSASRCACPLCNQSTTACSPLTAAGGRPAPQPIAWKVCLCDARLTEAAACSGAVPASGLVCGSLPPGARPGIRRGWIRRVGQRQLSQSASPYLMLTEESALSRLPRGWLARGRDGGDAEQRYLERWPAVCSAEVRADTTGSS